MSFSEADQRDYLAAWNDHDAERITTFFTDDARFEDVAMGQVSIGKEQIRVFAESYYRNGARITATEPDPYMLERARKRASEVPANIELQQVAAEDLPFPDDSFDFVVDTLVLCNVNDPALALSEIKRVLKPGGEIRMYEHVRYESGLGAFVQDVITPVWRWFGAGCHPNRDTGRAVLEAGFEVVSERREMAPVPRFIPSRPHLRLVARRPE